MVGQCDQFSHALALELLKHFLLVFLDFDLPLEGFRFGRQIDALILKDVEDPKRDLALEDDSPVEINLNIGIIEERMRLLNCFCFLLFWSGCQIGFLGTHASLPAGRTLFFIVDDLDLEDLNVGYAFGHVFLLI